MPVLGLVTPSPIIDFGTVWQGEVKHARFTITNHYGQSVTLHGIRASCNCTNARLSRKVLRPGNTVEVTADWEVGSGRGATRIQIRLDYQLEDGRSGQLPLVIKGTVQPDYRVEPAMLTFDTRNGVQTQSVSFQPDHQPDCRLMRASVTHRAFTVFAGRSESDVAVTFDPSAWMEEEGQSAQLVLETSSKNQPSYSIRLHVTRGDNP